MDSVTFADLLLFESFKKGSILLGRCFAKLDKLSSLVGSELDRFIGRLNENEESKAETGETCISQVRSVNVEFVHLRELFLLGNMDVGAPQRQQPV